MERQGMKGVKLSGAKNKRIITAVFYESLVGDFLPVQLIYLGSTTRCPPNYEFHPHWDITISKKHWSNEETMIRYIDNIIAPYVNAIRENFEDNTPAVIIMDNFEGQITPQISSLLKRNNIHTCLLPPNTTDCLQPMDLTVNNPAKDFLKCRLEEWYAKQITKQLEGQDIETAVLQPIDLSLPALKELGAKWMVELADYFGENPQIVVNGFVKAGIVQALDGQGFQDSNSESGMHTRQTVK